MSTTTSIEWTATVHPDGSVTPGSTWNPVRGCTKVSPGCAHCYAEVFAERWRGIEGHPYEQGFDLRLVPDKLTEPLSWKKPRRVFVNSMSDLFQDGVPFEFVDHVFATMAMAKPHTFQVLTKRPARMRDYLTDPKVRERIADVIGFGFSVPQIARSVLGERFDTDPGVRWPLPNVWLGVSVENQHFANERIPLLLQTPAAVRFLSCEPLLEHLNVIQFLSDKYISQGGRQWIGAGGISWVIVGGESGHGARPFEVNWARSIVKQCADSGVACFVKQLGAKPILEFAPRCDQILSLKSKKGGDPSEWPEDLRVRQFPQVPA